MEIVRLFCIVLFFGLGARLAFAAEITTSGIYDTGCEEVERDVLCSQVSLTGDIQKGDYEKLRVMIDGFVGLAAEGPFMVKIGRIEFSSPGGDLSEAMKIGRLIRSDMIQTVVFKGEHCNSACVIAFLGGVIRMPVGSMGIHSFYSKEFIGSPDFAGSSKKYNEISTFVEQYMKEMRIPVSLLDEMKMVPHNRVRVLSFDELKRLGVLGFDPVYQQVIDRD